MPTNQSARLDRLERRNGRQAPRFLVYWSHEFGMVECPLERLEDGTFRDRKTGEIVTDVYQLHWPEQRTITDADD